MINIKYPANAQLFANTLIYIVNAEILNPEMLSDVVFDFSANLRVVKVINGEVETEQELPPEAKYLIPQVQDMGFETYNSILNLGGIFIIIVFFLT